MDRLSRVIGKMIKVLWVVYGPIIKLKRIEQGTGGAVGRIVALLCILLAFVPVVFLDVLGFSLFFTIKTLVTYLLIFVSLSFLADSYFFSNKNIEIFYKKSLKNEDLKSLVNACLSLSYFWGWIFCLSLLLVIFGSIHFHYLDNFLS